MNHPPAVAVGTTRNSREPNGAVAISTDSRKTTGTGWLRPGLGLLVLAVLLSRIGAGPFVDGVRRVDPAALLVATAITALTTLCCARRWQLVARSLGLPLGLVEAVAAVYRAQFLNATLPGGVLGDVERALGHGRDNRAFGAAVRAVVWERTLGQVVQVGVTAAVLLAVPSPLQRPALLVTAAGGATLAVALLAGWLSGAALVRRIGSDLHRVLGNGGTRWGIVLTSAGSVAGHLLVLVVAARVAQVPGPAYALLPLAAVVLLASSVPVNVAGWGPREGVAAWAFAVAGLGATAGVTTSVVYGVMALVATLPGAVVLLLGRRRWLGRHGSSPLRLRALEGAARA